jgi:predicted transposase/invertase (TIGR01784 family)
MRKRTVLSFDYAIKRLLRDKSTFEIVEGFLSELFHRPVKIRELLESEGNQEDPQEKYNRVDLLAEEESGELIVIEVQFEYEIDYFQRMLFGVSKALVERLSTGQKYAEIKKIYSVNIVYCNLGEGDDYVYHGKTQFLGIHTKAALRLSKRQQERFCRMEPGDLYPEYYILNVKHFDDLPEDTLDEWVYYLKNGRIDDDFRAQGLDKARECWEYDRLSPEEKRAYDRDIDRQLGVDGSIESARDLGLQEGLQEGLQQGRQESALKIARSLKAKGFALDLIVEVTGLSPSEVAGL